jgi:predicted transcriptional regulator of viral defense system
VTRFSEPYLSAGVEVHEIEGVPVQVFAAAKTVADCFRMRSKVGYDVAVEALKEGWRLRKFTLDEVFHFAKLNRVDRIMRPYIEAITA